jgi:hypothetical protein
MKRITSFTIGMASGACSCVISSVFFGKFEPFDSSPSFYVGQVLLSALAGYFGFRHRFSVLLLLLIGMYVGQNAYMYLFGNSDSRAYFLLGLLMTVALIIYPFIVGFIGFTIKRVCKKKG